MSRCAYGADFAAHQARQPAGDRQPETGAAVLARRRHIGLFENLEQPVECVRGDTDTGVEYLEANQQFAAAVLQNPRAQIDGTPRGELDGVAGIVEQRLAQPGRVAMQPLRNLAGIDRHRELLVLRGFADDGGDIVEHGGEREVGAL